MLVMGTLLNFGFGFVGLEKGYENFKGWLIWWFFANPLFLCFYAIYSFTIDYGVSFGSILSTTFSLIIGFGMGIYILATLSQIGGIVIIVFFFYYFCIIGGYFSYLNNNKTWPTYFVQFIILKIIVLVILVSVALNIYASFNGFIIFSILYFIITFLVGLYAAMLLYTDHKNNA
jgi:hypothetical protein